MQKRGIFVMLDGLDLSGKGTAVLALKEWAEKKGKKVFDLREYNKKFHDFPDPAELKEYDVILSAEPTYAWTGFAIRNEIILDNGREYSAKETAEAYSNDRVLLYKRILIPLLNQGKIIFQERGNATSFAYQPLQAELRGEKLELEEVMNFAGNKFTLKYPPSLLIVTLCSENTMLERKKNRTEKEDNCIFEEVKFQGKLKHRYESKWFSSVFENLGTQIKFLYTDDIAIEETKKRILEIWERFLQEHNS